MEFKECWLYLPDRILEAIHALDKRSGNETVHAYLDVCEYVHTS